LKIPFNLLLENGEIKMKIFLISPRHLMGEGEGERVIKKIKNYQLRIFN